MPADKQEMLRHHADPMRDGVTRRADADFAAIDHNLPRVGLVNAVENVHERGLAGAVLAQQGMDFASADVQRHAVVGDDSREGLADLCDGEANGGAGRHRRQRRGCRCGMHMGGFAAGAARNLCGNVMRIMDVLLPRTLDEALEMKAAAPAAMPIAGGTDIMVELNFDRRRPATILDVSRLPELRTWRKEDGAFFLGAGVTYARIVNDLTMFPALMQASRTVGSPQIRNRATVGGTLGTASPAGDALPVLAAYDAEILLGRAGGMTRSLPWHEFIVGVKETAIQPDELILGARWRVVRGTGSFSKIGTRNAMVISMAGLCLVLDEDGRTVRAALGSVAPNIVRAPAAEAFAARALAEAGGWDDPQAAVPGGTLTGFGELVAAATSPIEGVRCTARHRAHA